MSEYFNWNNAAETAAFAAADGILRSIGHSGGGLAPLVVIGPIEDRCFLVAHATTLRSSDSDVWEDWVTYGPHCVYDADAGMARRALAVLVERRGGEVVAWLDQIDEMTGPFETVAELCLARRRRETADASRL